MKKLLFAALGLVLFLGACSDSSNDGDSGDKAETAYYHAAGETAGNGWTYYVSFNMDDNGDVTNFVFNAVNLKSGDKSTKKEMSEAGEYNLPDDAIAPWHEQAQAIIDYVNENDGFDGVEFNEEGGSDSISGATIKYGEAAELFDAAVANGPVEKGTETDGVYIGYGTEYEGWTDQVAYFVDYGHKIAVHVDSAKAGDDGKPVYKTDLAAEGEYKLSDDATAPLLEQYAAIEDYILNDDFGSVEVDGEGKSDAVSGATIGLAGFVEAYNNAE